MYNCVNTINLIIFMYLYKNDYINKLKYIESFYYMFIKTTRFNMNIKFSALFLLITVKSQFPMIRDR